MQIREATESDLETVTRLRLEFLAEHRGFGASEHDPAFVAQTLAFLARHASAGTSRSWLASASDADVGVATLLLLDLPPRPGDRSGREGYVVNMFVRAPARGNGIGRDLLDRVLTTARDLALRRVLLYATDDGRPLYEAVGFRHDPRWLQLALR